jgi:ribose transport system substrate-binding protein
MKFAKKLGMSSVAVALSVLASAAGAKEITLAFVAASLQYPHNVAVAKGFQDEAKKLGAKVLVLDSKTSVEKQGNAVDDLITQKVDGIAAILIDSVVAKTWVDKAAAANVGFVAAAVQVGDPDKVPLRQVYANLTALVTDDDVEAGQIAGEIAAKLLPKDRTAKIGVAEGAPGVAAVRQRNQGFEQALVKAGAKYKIVASQPTDWTAEKGESVCQNILTANPDLDLFFTHYDEIGMGCVRAIRAVGSKVMLVTAGGGSKRSNDAIQAGDMAGSVCTKPQTLGRLAARALYDAATNKNTPKARLITYKMPAVTKATLSECPPEF